MPSFFIVMSDYNLCFLLYTFYLISDICIPAIGVLIKTVGAHMLAETNTFNVTARKISVRSRAIRRYAPTVIKFHLFCLLFILHRPVIQYADTAAQCYGFRNPEL